MSSALALPLGIDVHLTKDPTIIKLDPRDSQVAWVDQPFGIAWNVPYAELRAVIEN